MEILQVGMLVVLLCLQQTSGKPSSRRDNENTGQCGLGLACGPECQKLCVTQHNYYRALHNLSPVRCDADLAESAQAWTDLQAQKGQLKRSPWRNLGQLAESISWKQWGWSGMADTRAAVPSAVRSWYSEKKGRIMDRTSVPENFQTIVRPDITRLGCGIHVIPGDGTYVTSHYGATPGGNALNDEIQIPAARDPEPTCQIKSFQREKCGNISSPYVTPDVCLRAGCCYDDVFNDEPLVLWYRREGSTWCYKGKNNEKEDQAMATNQENTLATTSNPVTQVSRNKYDKATSKGNAVDTINSLVHLDKNNKATNMESTTMAPTNIPANQESLENDGDEPKGFFKDCLDQHNKLRAKHGVPPLKWSDKLAANALKTAKMNADIGEMKHATYRNGEGENIYYFDPPQPQCEGPKVGNCFQCRKATNYWYKEIENYDFAAGKSKGGDILHFTQMVWAKTTLVGMATAVGHNKIYIVGRYWVTGNMGGKEAFIKNVPPPKGPGSTPGPKQPTPESTEGTTSLATAAPANTGPPGKGTTSANTASVSPTTPSSKPSGISKLVIDCKNNYGDSCYHFNDQGTKWTENREECKKKGGDLVSIETEGEWSFIKDKIQGLSNQLRNEWHIGLRKEGSTWKWVNGAPLTITHWQRGQPSGDGSCVVMAKNYPPGTKGGFNDLPDRMPSGYICEQKKVPHPRRPQLPTGAVTSAAAASSGFKTTSGGEDTAATVIDCRNNYGDSCYHFNEQGTKWTENREKCKKKGGDLVSIETEGEWSFIKDKIQGLSNQLRNEWHIGLIKDGSKWKWVNGNPLTITHWQRRQPSGDGPFAVMTKNYPPGTKGGFNDLSDWIPSGYICEKKVIDCRNNYGGSCYHFKEQGTTWTENREKCKKNGGDLVSIEKEGEWSFIKDKLQGLNNQLRNEWHIGLTKEGSTWKWVNGALLTITHWQRGQPSGDGRRVVMAKNYPPGTQGGFNDLPDRIPSGYICEQKEVPRPWRPLPTGKGTSAAVTTSGAKTTSGGEETTTAATAAPGGGQTGEWMNVGSCGKGLI